MKKSDVVSDRKVYSKELKKKHEQTTLSMTYAQGNVIAEQKYLTKKRKLRTISVTFTTVGSEEQMNPQTF